MTRHARPFTQSDVSRACKGVQASGLPVSRVVISDSGRIEVFIGPTVTQAATVDDAMSPAQKWEAARAARKI
jgi:hypothetical protein